jgi:hypothetical protein
MLQSHAEILSAVEAAVHAFQTHLVKDGVFITMIADHQLLLSAPLIWIAEVAFALRVVLGWFMLLRRPTCVSNPTHRYLTGGGIISGG